MTGGEIAAVLAAVTFGSFIKSVTGMGFPIIAIPIISLAVGIEDAIVIVAIPNALSNAILCRRERHWVGETRDLPALIGFGIAGAVAGTILLVTLPERPVLIVLVATIVVYIAMFFARPDFVVDDRRSRRWSPVVGTIAGLMQGSTGVSGPIVIPWIHAFRLPRSAYIFSITGMFFLTGVTQLIVLGVQGEFGRDRLVAALAAIIPTLLMIPVGVALRDRLAGRAFDLTVLAVLGASGLSLLVRALS